MLQKKAEREAEILEKTVSFFAQKTQVRRTVCCYKCVFFTDSVRPMCMELVPQAHILCVCVLFLAQKQIESFDNAVKVLMKEPDLALLQNEVTNAVQTFTASGLQVRVI